MTCLVAHTTRVRDMSSDVVKRMVDTGHISSGLSIDQRSRLSSILAT